MIDVVTSYIHRTPSSRNIRDRDESISSSRHKGETTHTVSPKKRTTLAGSNAALFVSCPSSAWITTHRRHVERLERDLRPARHVERPSPEPKPSSSSRKLRSVNMSRKLRWLIKVDARSGLPHVLKMGGRRQNRSFHCHRDQAAVPAKQRAKADPGTRSLLLIAIHVFASSAMNRQGRLVWVSVQLLFMTSVDLLFHCDDCDVYVCFNENALIDLTTLTAVTYGACTECASKSVLPFSLNDSDFKPVVISCGSEVFVGRSISLAEQRRRVRRLGS